MWLSVKHIILTRFSVHQKEWSERPTNEWLAHRWELFNETVLAVEKQTVSHEWWLICHHSTPPDYLYSLRQNGRVVVVGNDWLHTVQELMPEGQKITTRLDSDDLIAPNYLETVEQAAAKLKGPGFICSQFGYQESGGIYYEHDELFGPFMSYAETGNQTVYCRAHGNGLKRERAVHMDGRLYVQRVHGRNLRNKLRSSEIVKAPLWAC